MEAQSAYLKKPLGGEAGYKRLVRLLARAFYSGECPPKEDSSPGDQEPLTEAAKLKAMKQNTVGLGVLLLDLLVATPGYLHEDRLAEALRLSSKNVRKALRYLEGEGLLASETVKKAFKRQMAEAVDDAEVEEKKRHETHVYWCVAFPALTDSLRLRLHRAREFLKKKAEDAGAVAEYICPQCGATATSLDAARLLDPLSLTFRCEHCGGELQEHIQGVKGGAGVAATTNGASQLSYREAQEAFKTLRQQFETQLAPIIEQLEKLRDVEPPDYGSLRDWALAEKEKVRKRAARIEAARARARAGGVAGADEMDEQALLEWADRAEVQVNFGEETGPAQAAAAAGKELPSWFKQPEAAGGAAAGGAVTSAAAEEAAAAAAAAAAEAEQRRLQQEYLRAYLAQQQAALALDAGAALAGEARESKRIKTENGYVKQEQQGLQQQQVGVKAEAEEEAGLGWEEVKAEPKQEQQQQQQGQPEIATAGGEGEDEDLMFEDI